VRRGLFSGLLVAAMALFIGLGVWQVQRRTWKLNLIATVESRVHAPAQPAPGPAVWRGFAADAQAYDHVQIAGQWLGDRTTLVQALTELGGGFWLVTPLRTESGWIVLVNRGFVPFERELATKTGAAAPAGKVTITGLLRPTEPGGGFLRSNDPAHDQWFSRDVAAIAAARGIDSAAPYFIDADATANPGGYPVGGLTVIAFRNAHLVYALTWFSLAVLSVAGLWILHRGRFAIKTA
jgi:surfeit locus 1 family protein